MTLSRFVFKSHKWLAVPTGVITFLWFFSGILMTVPNRLLRAVAGPQPQVGRAQTGESPYRTLRISIPDAIAAVDRSGGHALNVRDVSMRSIEGQLYYRISTEEGVRLVNGNDGSLLTISGDVARRILVHGGIPAEQLGAVAFLKEYNLEYPYGPLPAWRVESHDAKATIYYVGVDGELRSSRRLGRIHEFLMGMHTLEFLSPWFRIGILRLIMWIFSILGTTMTLFGFWILWIQYKNWLERRAG